MEALPVSNDTPDFLAVTTSLAMELAAGLSEPTEIFSRHGFNDEDARKLLQTTQFQSLLKEAKASWSADDNIADRIRKKAQMCLEESLLPTFSMAQSENIPPPARLDAVKLFERLSGVAKTEEGGGGGPRFVLNINLGGDDPPREISGEMLKVEDRGDAV